MLKIAIVSKWLKERYKMRCKMCSNISKNPKLKCWSKWQLCIYCATKIHPEEYKPSQQRKVIKTRKTRFRKCQKCDSLMFTLRYNSSASFIAPFMYCRKCNVMKEVEI